MQNTDGTTEDVPHTLTECKANACVTSVMTLSPYRAG